MKRKLMLFAVAFIVALLLSALLVPHLSKSSRMAQNTSNRRVGSGRYGGYGGGGGVAPPASNLSRASSQESIGAERVATYGWRDRDGNRYGGGMGGMGGYGGGQGPGSVS